MICVLRLRKRHTHCRQVRRVEAGVHVDEAPEADGQQGCANKQDERQRELYDDQRGSHAPRTRARRSRTSSLGKRRGGVIA